MAGNSQMNSSKGAWKSAIFIIFVEVAERFAYYGVSGNLFSYLIKEVGQPTATAAKNVNIWQGVSALFPVVGGFLADSYTGRFWTILFSSIIYLTNYGSASLYCFLAFPPIYFGSMFSCILFEPYKDNKVDLLLPKLVFIALNLVGLGMGVWKLNTLGLLPTHVSDWVSSLPPAQEVEFSGGGIPLQ
ncbi:NRT1 PTR FAMILY [Olea europaea subsp. europaea]|uniref:ER membrane protein complex subunit 4 n=1 Tax=Olea europaea subsp. europaea TaxID=158383 RepID=A0A8S0TSI3_OLEEU|nr:NRT1 PTR FAMILY [Olea europaea subsp. europaea]